MARMAKDFLAVSATGVPVERLFSTGTNVVTPNRGSLSSESIRETMCLREWLKADYTLTECFGSGVSERAGVFSVED